MDNIIINGTLIGAAMIAMIATADAQTPEGPYVAIHAGVNFGDDNSLDVPMFRTRVQIDTQTKVGVSAGASVGYSFGSFGPVTPRVELEGTWRSNSVKSASIKAFNMDVDGFGRVNSVAGMVNAIVDIDTGTSVYPYVGIGVGAALPWMSTPDGTYTASAPVFAYQGIAGLGVNVTDGIGVTLDYRYFRSGGTENQGVKYGGHGDHTVTLGLRYSFGDW